MVFSVNVSTNDPVNVTTEWFLSGNKVGNGLMYVFRTDYNSSSNSPYRISFRASHPECGNITLNWTVTVLNVNRPPTLQVSPKNQTLHTTVGERVEFSAVAEDPDGDAVEINWYVNSTFSRKGEVFNFTADAEGIYNITVEASDTEETVFFTWTLYVSSPPPPPKPATITNRTPKEKTLVLYESESIEMRVGLQMGDWHLQNVKWYLGENVVGEGVYNYTFQSSYMGLGSSQFSPYHLSFQALFDEGLLWENWTIIVLDVNRDPTILNVSITISNISGREGRMVNLSANAVDPDGDALNFVWYVDGEEALKGREGGVYLQPGNHTISLNVSDGKGGRCIYVRVISVPPAEGEANGEREVPLLKEKRISLYVLLIIAVIVILFLYRSLALSKPPREEDYFE
ncbi:MAG: PKD domain-containing protein [Thermoplasmata archaeon]|nr:PKD domain-containing protein [Thermoplasmata archaeon]